METGGGEEWFDAKSPCGEGAGDGEDRKGPVESGLKCSERKLTRDVIAVAKVLSGVVDRLGGCMSMVSVHGGASLNEVSGDDRFGGVFFVLGMVFMKEACVVTMVFTGIQKKGSCRLVRF